MSNVDRVDDDGMAIEEAGVDDVPWSSNLRWVIVEGRDVTDRKSSSIRTGSPLDKSWEVDECCRGVGADWVPEESYEPCC